METAAMMNLSKLDEHRKEVEALSASYDELHDLMFTNELNLSDAGRGVVAELKRRGKRQKDAARILGISPAAAYNNWHAV